MTSIKRLQAAAHDIGHHAQSGLSYLHPYLCEMAIATGLTHARIDLLRERPYPEALPEHGPLRLAVGVLREKFVHILAGYGLERALVASVTLEFSFPRERDCYSSRVSVRVVSASGREFRAQLDLPGELRIPTA
jgi:hypothetical protein